MRTAEIAGNDWEINLIGMGVLPLRFREGVTRKSLKLDGSETITITGLEHLQPNDDVTMVINHTDGSTEEVKLLVRIETQNEMEYYKNGGILHYVLRNLLV